MKPILSASKKLIRQMVLVLLFGVVISTNTKATHIAGGDISYECLGFNNNTQHVNLRVTLNVYRDATCLIYRQGSVFAAGIR